MLLLRTLNTPLKAATLPFENNTCSRTVQDCSRTITITTIECGKANKHEFRYPYTLSSMLAKYMY